MDMLKWYNSGRTVLRRGIGLLTKKFGPILRQEGYINFNPLYFNRKAFASYYRQEILHLPRPIVAIVEHPDFSYLVDLNQELGIKTLVCPHNLESLDGAIPLTLEGFKSSSGKMKDLGTELRALSRFSDRLFISKLEAGLASGLGLSSKYYPYLPVGEIRRQLELIREKRASSETRENVFLMLGTVAHNPTRLGFEWVLDHILRDGLPGGMRLMVAGHSSEKLAAFHEGENRRVEFLGFTPQDRLNSLLKTVRAVLVPQFSGFGSITRVVEMSCAGIPVLTSENPGYAFSDLPPGVKVLGRTWQSWYEYMGRFVNSEFNPGAGRFDRWENGVANTLHEVLIGLI